MGLILGPDGKKMKSRTGDSVSAQNVIDEIKSRFEPTPRPDQLAWNVLAWNFLQVARAKNVKYTPEEWTKVESPGMYITYTYARLKSALRNGGYRDPNFDFIQSDADLIGFANQYHYHKARVVEKLDPAILANFTHDLARKLGVAYHSEKIQGGRYGFKYAMKLATDVLQKCLNDLGMFDLETV